jgi:hypothetical protein
MSPKVALFGPRAIRGAGPRYPDERTSLLVDRPQVCILRRCGIDDPQSVFPPTRAQSSSPQAWLTLGEVVAVHIDKAMIRDGVYQTGLARPIVRAGRRGDYFEIRPEAMFEMIRPD